MKCIKGFVLWGAAIAALIAAYLWYHSGNVFVPISNEPDESGLIPASVGMTDAKKSFDVNQTALEQAKWNKRAASAACVSAVLQGIGLVL